MPTDGNLQLRAGQAQCAHDLHCEGIEDQQLVPSGGKNFTIRCECGRIIRGAGQECGFENFFLKFWIESKEFGLLFGGPGSAASVNAAAAENEAGLRLKRQGNNALVRHEIAVILDGSVSAWLPNPQRAAQLAVRRLASDKDQTVRPANHRAW